VAAAATPTTLGGRLASILVSVATAFVLLGLSIVPFFTPQWIHGEQLRAEASVPGYSETAVAYATDMTVAALLSGGGFGFMVDPGMQPASRPAIRFGSGTLSYAPPQALFFDAREIGHMEDVRRVFAGLAVVIALSVAILALAVIRTRGTGARRAAVWRAVARGALGLAGFMVAVGILSIVAFDAAFQLFHELLFPAGSFSFDPRTERLVQLFPDRFWSETSLALGILALVLSIGVTVVARRRAARLGGAIETADAAGASIGATNGSPA